MWNETRIEKLLKEKLQTLDSSVPHHDKFYQQYEQVRQYMCTDIYSNIARIEPNLSDHGEIHIQNVLQNAYKLIEHSLDKINKYTPLDLYVLCTAILIHDIGNIHGRNGHEEKLTEVYMSNDQFLGIDNIEKRLIAKIAASHGGKENIISNLPNEEHISGERIQSKCIAGLLRFADELAEGPQRTSQYLIEKKLISDDSEVYHHYASILELPVIKLDSIVLRYNIYTSKILEVELVKLLIFLYSRIYKLNRERINCGVYSEHIQRLKKVAVTINFFENSGDMDIIKIDRKLTIFELNNLDCNRIEESEIKEKYTNDLISELKKFCKQEG